MKHVFLVHSPITYLVSVSIISELKLPNEDSIIIFHEFDRIEQADLYISVSLNEFYTKTLSKKLISYVRHFNLVRRMDTLLDAVLKGEKFVAYVPVLTRIGKSLITNAKCCAFNFIEEGL